MMQAAKPLMALTFTTPKELLTFSQKVQPLNNLKLGDLLLADKMISPQQLKHALTLQKVKPDHRIGALLISLGYAEEDQIHAILMKKFGFPIVNPTEFPISDAVKNILSYEMAEKYDVLPLLKIKKRLFLAMVDPMDWEVINRISSKTGLSIEPVLAYASDIKSSIAIRRKHTVHKKREKVIPLDPSIQIEDNQNTIPQTKSPVVGLPRRPLIKDASSVKASKLPKKLANKLKIGSIIRDRFIIVAFIGKGGMGDVYKAIDKRRQEAKDTNCVVAIKVLNDDFKNHPSAFVSLQREARKTQFLMHPNIVTVNDFDRDGDTIYLVMEYLEGQSINNMIRTRYSHGMPVEKTFTMINEIADALQFAHERHIIHCDFKPGNAFLTKSGQTKIIDFGIARISSTATEENRPNFLDVGLVSGCTPAYATYELFYGKEPAPSDDVYALACTAYKMLTGKHPFQGHNAVEAKRLKLEPKRITCLSHRQWKGLLKGLAFEKENRTSSARQFWLDLSCRQFTLKEIAIWICRKFSQMLPEKFMSNKICATK